MIIGYAKVHQKTSELETHRDSYQLANLSAVSVRRPYMAGAMLLAGGAIGFTAAFGDLMQNGEIFFTVAAALAALFAGFQAGQLSLVSRDLKGTEISSALWGQHKHLQAKRREIMCAIHASRSGGNDA